MNGRGRNKSTVYTPGRRGQVSFASSFEAAFLEIDRLVRSFPQDGVLVAAVMEPGVVDKYLHIPVAERPEFATVGRHDQCDLVLSGDEGVSLRHIVIAAARHGLDEVRIRVIDLQTGSGLLTEDGRPCEALLAEGPVFVHMGAYQLFILPTGTLAQYGWGRSAQEAWSAVPERVYLNHSIRSQDPMEGPSIPAPSRRMSRTLLLPPAEPLGRRPAPGDPGAQVGILEVASANRAKAFPVHVRDMRRGILIGRYPRCDIGVPDAGLSRVHLLILEHEHQWWAVDTGSSNGVHQADRRVRQLVLGHAATFSVGHEIELRWKAAS
jgi:hypothetical protein